MIEYNYIVKNISEQSDEAAYRAYIPAFKAYVYGDNLVELEEGIVFTIESEISDRQTQNLPIPKPERDIKYSGKLLLRINPAIHERIALEAQLTGTSINKCIESKLAVA